MHDNYHSSLILRQGADTQNNILPFMTMTDLTHFESLPLEVKLQFKTCAISIIHPASSALHSTRAIAAELDALNSLLREMQQLDTPNVVPGPPMPVHPKRSAAIIKMKDSGGDQFRKGNHVDADRQYSLALQMAMSRPTWEPVTLIRDEVSLLLANRAQIRMTAGRWAEGAVDAEASVEAKRVGNAKAWWRRGKCLAQMGRWEEAREWVGRALEVEGNEADLVALAEDIERKFDRKIDII